ncbi:MAG: hypothetical protein ACYTHM_12235 [Planctomycetota bacterium]|jgi:hypothetical protein
MDNITFTSTIFPVVAHEDENINPGVLGKTLAEWIQRTLKGTRFEITEWIEEDFGYCLMIHRKPYWLWVGCAGATDHEYPVNGLTEEIAASFPLASIEWHVFVATEWGLISRLLGKDNRKADVRELLTLIRKRLEEECDVTFL